MLNGSSLVGSLKGYNVGDLVGGAVDSWTGNKVGGFDIASSSSPLADGAVDS